MKNILYCLLAFFLLLPSGCYSLRKKFVRKKDAQAESTICVDLKEYPKGDSRSAYLDHAVFFRGWVSEAMHILEQNGNRKRIAYSMQEAADSLRGMADLCDDVSKGGIDLLRQKLLDLRSEFLLSGVNINERHFILELEMIRKKFEKSLSTVNMKSDSL
jgi:hypothetical protein